MCSPTTRKILWGNVKGRNLINSRTFSFKTVFGYLKDANHHASQHMLKLQAYKAIFVNIYVHNTQTYKYYCWEIYE